MQEIILEGRDLDAKIRSLEKVKIDPDFYRTYYRDAETGEKWVLEDLFTATVGGGPPQLRMIERFPWE